MRASLKRMRRSTTLPHVTSRVPRIVYAKFHVNWSKIVGARGIHTDRHTHKQTYSPSLIIQSSLASNFVTLQASPAGYSIALLHRALCFALAFSVALLSQASSFALATCSLCSRASHLQKFFFLKSVSKSTRNALKLVEMQKKRRKKKINKIFTPFT